MLNLLHLGKITTTENILNIPIPETVEYLISDWRNPKINPIQTSKKLKYIETDTIEEVHF